MIFHTVAKSFICAISQKHNNSVIIKFKRLIMALQFYVSLHILQSLYDI